MASVVEMQSDILQLFSYVGHPPRADDLEYENANLKNALGKISTGDSFDFFNSADLDEAKKFYTILLAAKGHEEFMTLAWDARNKMNKRMFVFATSWAVQDSPLYSGVYCPPVEEIAPEYFIPFETIVEAVYQYHDVNDSLVIPVHPTGSWEDEEYRLAYFREDIGINSHHWHWHLVYPSNGKTKDRQGELFYYMHQQMLARYDADRLAFGLKRVIPLRQHNFDDVLMGYASHLALEHGKRPGSRPDGMHLKYTADLVRWRERIMEAVHRGFLIDERGRQVPLNNDSGIDILAAVFEPSSASVNRNYYGRLHNTLHTEIARIHDVQNKFKELPGVIGDISTAVRDPVFFMLHKFVDDVFAEHKNQLSPYTRKELTFRDIQITKVLVEGFEENVISTYTRKGTLGLNYAIPIFAPEHKVQDLSTSPSPRNSKTAKYHFGYLRISAESRAMSNRLDPTTAMKAERQFKLIQRLWKCGHQYSSVITLPFSTWVKFDHLDHYPFFYRITANNASPITKHSNVRIFMAPKFDENGRNLTLVGRRRHFIELDKFYWPSSARIGWTALIISLDSMEFNVRSSASRNRIFTKSYENNEEFDIWSPREEHFQVGPGDNEIIRESIYSSVTIRKDRMPTAEMLRFMIDNKECLCSRSYMDYCSCGWPHHMLIPRGTENGMDFRLFVMLTDYYEDNVHIYETGEDKMQPEVLIMDDKLDCTGSVSYCGAKDSKYPDKRPMGFPFDKRIPVPPSNPGNETEDYVEDAFKTPNMFFTDIKVQFKVDI